jgi:hypothetical protein
VSAKTLLKATRAVEKTSLESILNDGGSRKDDVGSRKDDVLGLELNVVLAVNGDQKIQKRRMFHQLK